MYKKVIYRRIKNRGESKMKGKWLSLNEEVFQKEKRRALRTMNNGLDITFVWIKLIELALEINDNGLVYIRENEPYTAKTLSSKLKLSEDLIEFSLRKMRELSIIEIYDSGIIKCFNWRGTKILLDDKGKEIYENPYKFI